MNLFLETSARDFLKENIISCTEEQQFLFKRMYAKGNLELDIMDVIDNMDESKLDWAMQQVSTTLSKRKGGNTYEEIKQST